MDSDESLGREPSGPTDDAGFTLVEVVVALGLLGIIATATLGFFISGTRSSADLQRRQVAVALANAAVEDARRLPVAIQTSTANGTTASWPLLVRGRLSTDVTTQRAAAPASFTSTTFAASDPGATAGAAQLAPLSRTDQLDGVDYTTAVLIGTCYRSRAAGDQPCDQAGRARTTTPPSGYEELVRISAVTTWASGTTTCSGAGCSYTASVLVDTATDPQWNTYGGRAVDDVATVRAGTSPTLNVLANDTLIPADINPVTIVSVPSGLTASADSSGGVRVTVPSSTTPRTVTLTYNVKDAYNAVSNTASVRITVTS